MMTMHNSYQRETTNFFMDAPRMHLMNSADHLDIRFGFGAEGPVTTSAIQSSQCAKMAALPTDFANLGKTAEVWGSGLPLEGWFLKFLWFASGIYLPIVIDDYQVSTTAQIHLRPSMNAMSFPPISYKHLEAPLCGAPLDRNWRMASRSAWWAVAMSPTEPWQG